MWGDKGGRNASQRKAFTNECDRYQQQHQRPRARRPFHVEPDFRNRNSDPTQTKITPKIGYLDWW